MSDETIASVTMLSPRCLGDGFCFFLMYSKSTRNFKPTFSLRRASNSMAGLSAVPSFARAQGITKRLAVLIRSLASEFFRSSICPKDSSLMTPDSGVYPAWDF